MTAFEEGAVFSSRNHLYYQSQECPASHQCCPRAPHRSSALVSLLVRLLFHKAVGARAWYFTSSGGVDFRVYSLWRLFLFLCH